MYDTTPHMRGILIAGLIRMSPSRYNPAHAGNPTSIETVAKSISIQPRTCGESCLRQRIYPRPVDTTPHMRGIQDRHLDRRSADGYNPAHAGNLNVQFFLLHRVQIQPRTCGESPWLVRYQDGILSRMSARLQNMLSVFAGAWRFMHFLRSSPALFLAITSASSFHSIPL